MFRKFAFSKIVIANTLHHPSTKIMYLDIQAISTQFGVTQADIALAMFPDNTFSAAALTRMETERNSDYKMSHLYPLAEFLGCTVRRLMPVEGYFKSLVDGVYTFTKGDVRITYDPAEQTACIYLRDIKAYDEVLIASSLSQSVFLAEMDSHVQRLRAENAE